MVHEEMLLKDVSDLELWQPSLLSEPNHLCNFGNGYYEEQLYDIIMNLGQWFKEEMSFKRFLIWSYGSPTAQ